MRYFLFILLIPSISWASVCEKAWNKSQRDKILCRLEWMSKTEEASGLELVELAEGCGLHEKDKVRCVILRACGPRGEGDKGASVFRSDVSPHSYCISGKEQEVFGPTSDSSPRAYISCESPNRPRSIRLVSPDGLITKECAFPFKDKP